MNSLTIRQPDDWHVHLRDGPMLGAVLDATARDFARAIVMPNLKPPVTTTAAAEAYRARIRGQLARNRAFTPLMACYLTDTVSPDDLADGHARGVLTAVKLYPAGATTNSDAGVTDLRKVYSVLERLQRIGMPLLVHGESVDPTVDIFDREAVFIERQLIPLRRDFPALKIVFEHLTSRDGVDYLLGAEGHVAATLTPHHLMINRNAMFDRGIRPHMYCLPVAKREAHRLALRAAAVSGNPRFFLGTDSAPHLRQLKEHECGCAGMFNAPTALACYAQVFDEEGRLDRLEDFASRFGAEFYGLPLNTGTVTLVREPDDTGLDWPTPDGAVHPFHPPGGLAWRVRRPAA